MDGKLLNYLEVKKLETLPTKQDLIATIARLINQASPGAAAMARWRGRGGGGGGCGSGSGAL